MKSVQSKVTVGTARDRTTEVGAWPRGAAYNTARRVPWAWSPDVKVPQTRTAVQKGPGGPPCLARSGTRARSRQSGRATACCCGPGLRLCRMRTPKRQCVL
uniref:Uncharacterized protein n=1 Tax=Pavo cristatus TaxID=9049 RepID=A0A8C9LDH2_PAVCR